MTKSCVASSRCGHHAVLQINRYGWLTGIVSLLCRDLATEIPQVMYPQLAAAEGPFETNPIVHKNIFDLSCDSAHSRQ